MRARAASLVSLALLCSCSAFSWEHDADHLIESALNITRGHGAGAHSRDLYLPPPSLCWLRRSAARRAARPTRPSPRCVWPVLTSAGGECAIGVGCGVVAGWLFRKLQARAAASHRPPRARASAHRSPVGRPPSIPAPLSLACSSQTLPSCSGRTVAHRQSPPALL